VHAFAFGHQRQQCVHHRRFARRRRALDQDRQRLIQLARHARQIPDQRRAVLADHADRGHVGDDAVYQVGIAQQRKGFGGVALGQRWHDGGLRRRSRFDFGVLQGFELEQELAQVALDHAFLDAQLQVRLLDEHCPHLGLIQVERIDVHPAFVRCQHVDLEYVEGEILLQAPDAIAPLAEAQHDIVLAYLGWDVLRRPRRRRTRLGQIGHRRSGS